MPDGAWKLGSNTVFARTAVPVSLMMAIAACGVDASLTMATLTIGDATVQAEIARATEDLQRGLMGRERLAPDTGMLFVFPRRGVHCMWMKDTGIPLSVAFMDGSGRILNTADMAPNTEDAHCAAGHASYALEVPQGLFARHGIRSGDHVSGIPSNQGCASWSTGHTSTINHSVKEKCQ